MNDERAQGTRQSHEAKLAIVHHLHGCWPNPSTVTPRFVAAGMSARAFIEAAVALQDEGLIMYEILLIGAGPEPILRDALLTRKGQLCATQRPMTKLPL